MSAAAAAAAGASSSAPLSVIDKRRKHNVHPARHSVVTRPPLDPIVLCDIERLLASFEASNLRSLASFKALSGQFRIRDLFLTFRSGERVPPSGETVAEYSGLLFEALVRRAVDLTRSFEQRLGSMYLLLLLHELQPCRPRAEIPVLESQWRGFEQLAQELRMLRHEEGFACLHALWTGHRLSHRAGARTSVNAADLECELEAERRARRLPATLSVDKLGPCPWAVQCVEQLALLDDLERRYDAVRPAGARVAAGASSGVVLRRELRSYHPHLALPPLPSGQAELPARGAAAAPTASSAAAAVLQASGAGDEALARGYRRREDVRHRPYAPRRARTADGGADHSGSARQRRRDGALTRDDEAPAGPLEPGQSDAAAAADAADGTQPGPEGDATTTT